MDARRVGPYELERLLGEGGIGQVYAARDTVIGRPVAIKTLRPELAHDRHLMERFLIEARSLGKLTHPNITTIYTLYTEGETTFMIMELVRGQTLEAMLARAHRFDLLDALAVIAQAAAGLDYAHQTGIVHRDIKPSNLMVTEAGVLKIMDFGIARMQGAQNLTRTGDFQGTLSFASPEQIRGDPVDEHTDQYSLAVVMYKMLTGAAPFAADNDYALMTAHLQNPPPSLLGRVPGLDGDVEAALMRALAKQPGERFASVEDFAQAVGAAGIRSEAVDILHQCVETIERGDAAEQTLVTSRPRGSASNRRAGGSRSAALPSSMREVSAPAGRVAPQPAPLHSRWPWFAAAAAVAVVVAAGGGYFFLMPTPDRPPVATAAAPKNPAAPVPSPPAAPKPPSAAEPGPPPPPEPVAPATAPASAPASSLPAPGTSSPGAPQPNRSASAETTTPSAPGPTASPMATAPGATPLPPGPPVPSQPAAAESELPSQATAHGPPPAPAPSAPSAPAPAAPVPPIAAPPTPPSASAMPKSPESSPSQESTSAPPVATGGEATWSLDEKRGVQEALRSLGLLAGVADGDFGPQTRAAIAQYLAFANEPESGQLSDEERRQLLGMASRLNALLEAPAISPKGVAAASSRTGAERLARAANATAAGDRVEAAYWYRSAAANGEPKAFTNLGTLLVRGVGADKPDPASAKLLWLTAAARGEPIAMFNLGAMYERGIGVDSDPAIARKWYERAATRGHPEAREALRRLKP